MDSSRELDAVIKSPPSASITFSTLINRNSRQSYWQSANRILKEVDPDKIHPATVSKEKDLMKIEKSLLDAAFSVVQV